MRSGCGNYSAAKALLLILVASCGVAQRGDDSQGGTGTTLDAPLAPDCSNTTCLSPYAKQHLYYSVTPVSGIGGDSFSATNLPSWASMNAGTGEITGYPTEGASHEDIMVSRTRGGEVTQHGPYTIFVSGDPLVAYTWFFENTGSEKSFSQSAGLSGEDLEAFSAWRLLDASSNNITGKNVKVAVSDTGLEIAHQDLADNMRNSANRRYSGGTISVGGNPTNTVSTKGDHGTSVAGLIAATGWNGVGSRGVAPGALLSGLNFLSSSQSDAFLVDQASGDFDIFNQSWGVEDDAWAALPLSYVNQIVDGVTNGRGGKGSLYVRASGNSFYQYVNSSAGLYWSRPSNASADNALPQVIVVGATNAAGEKASYSSTGSNLWVSAPGGEFGTQDPAMITADQAGCSKGYARTGVSGFESSASLNKSCNYTAKFNGTSSAAPVVSGVIALMLQANPNLSWRDVKHILASTSEKIDASWPGGDSALFYQRSWDPAGYVYEMPWITNHAGFNFHNWYGFGRVNAHAAVTAAKNYSTDLGTFKSFSVDSGSGDLNLTIPDDSSVGTTHDLVVDAGAGNGMIIEAVTVQLDINHDYEGDVGVELLGPEQASVRTKSILFNVNNSFESDDWSWSKGVTFLTNAYYGETSDGTWTLKVVDGDAAYQGKLRRWKITIYGRDP